MLRHCLPHLPSSFVFHHTLKFLLPVLPWQVAKALEVAGTVEALVGGILGRPTSSFAATLQLCVPVMLVSAFVNDTPVVAMMMPVVERWCARALLSPSKLLLPMSFSAMLGGTITVIGSSTNLIVQDLILRDVAAGRDPGELTTCAICRPCNHQPGPPTPWHPVSQNGGNLYNGVCH